MSNLQAAPTKTADDIRAAIAPGIEKLAPSRIVAVNACDLRTLGVSVEKAIPDLRPVELSVERLKAALAKK